MKTEDLMAKAAQAVTSAKMLLDAGDADGACNKAYYAMSVAKSPSPCSRLGRFFSATHPCPSTPCVWIIVFAKSSPIVVIFMRHIVPQLGEATCSVTLAHRDTV